MDLHTIEQRVQSLSKYIQEIVIVLHQGRPFAFIYPNFEALQKDKIINIRSEILWYGLELYNMEVALEEGIRDFKVFSHPLPKKEDGSYNIEALERALEEHEDIDFTQLEEPEDPIYRSLHSYIATLTSKEVLCSSHLELDLALDSLDYVALFTFIEESFGVRVDEAIFAQNMRLIDLYHYVKKHHIYHYPSPRSWGEMIKESFDEKLISSPIVVALFKIVLYPLFKLYFRFEVSGRENIPSHSCIIAPTHESMLDGFLIESSLSFKTLKNTFFLAYEGVFGNKYLRPVSTNGQLLLIDANNNLKRSMQRAALALEAKKNLVIFPEGARSRDGNLLEFRPFFAMLSREYNVPIVPAVIEGSFGALRAGQLFPRPAKIKVKYLEPIEPDNLSYEELTQKVREMIEREKGIAPKSP